MTKGVFTMSQTLGQYKQEQEKHWHITPALLFRWISQQFCNFVLGSEYPILHGPIGTNKNANSSLHKNRTVHAH